MQKTLVIDAQIPIYEFCISLTNFLQLFVFLLQVQNIRASILTRKEVLNLIYIIYKKIGGYS